jgi:RNA polymerase sigma factor (sigma-70 family)
MKCLDVNPSDGTSGVTSSELLRAARRCDADAWHRLVGTYSRRMYRWCRLRGLQPEDSANVVQEALAAVARKLGDFEHDRSGATFRGWLRRIVENKIADHFRRLGRQADLPIGGTDACERLAEIAMSESNGSDSWEGEMVVPPAEQIGLDDTIAEVRRTVGERDWTFFWRMAIDGQAAAEVGREFGVSANAVRLVKMRVLRRLRGVLNASPPHQAE